MPFDDPSVRVEIDVANAEEIAILDGMARRLATPDLWCKHALAIGPRRCLLGVANEEDHVSFRNIHDNNIFNIFRFNRHATETVWQRLIVLCPPIDVPRGGPVRFNNADTTTHADILGLIQRARASFE
jgi:hypothetical protein